MKTKYFLKVNEYVGMPKLSDFKIIEEDIDDKLEENELLADALAISVDPYVRAHDFPAGQPVSGFKAAKVLKSRIAEYPEGCVIMYHGDWKTIEKVKKAAIWYRVDTMLSDKEVTRAVGVLGMPGLTAYHGCLDICKPKEGETFMINACTGAVGSLVGQIAKLKGCKVVGCCGSEEKMAFAKSIGYDDVFNYKTEKSYPDALKRVAPNGIDCFFDNVGGQLASDILAHMNHYGRVSSCGCISSYNSTEKMKGPVLMCCLKGCINLEHCSSDFHTEGDHFDYLLLRRYNYDKITDVVQGYVVSQRLEMRGFIISDPIHRPMYPKAIKEMSEWIANGKLKIQEHVTEGFENLPQAFINLLCGTHIGKAVVRVKSSGMKF